MHENMKAHEVGFLKAFLSLHLNCWVHLATPKGFWMCSLYPSRHPQFKLSTLQVGYNTKITTSCIIQALSLIVSHGKIRCLIFSVFHVFYFNSIYSCSYRCLHLFQSIMQGYWYVPVSISSRHILINARFVTLSLSGGRQFINEPFKHFFSVSMTDFGTMC